MSCSPKCIYSTDPHESCKRPIMVSESEKGKFKFGTKHEQCAECMLEEINRALFPQEQALFDQFEKLKVKW